MNICLPKLIIENGGPLGLGGDAINVKPYAEFVELGRCNLQWDYPHEWGVEWQFKGGNANECLDQGLTYHIGGFDLQEHRVIYKDSSTSMLVYYGVEGQNRARVITMTPGPTLFLRIPGKYEMRLVFRGLDTDGKLFSSKKRRYEISLESWNKFSITELS